MMKAESRKKYLVCIDSDGCAIDSMTVKHKKAFGPAFVQIWQVPEDKRDAVLNEWNDINLFSLTRGINRFQGLAAILSLHPEYTDAEQLDSLVAWTKKTKALSSSALKQEYSQNGQEILKKALVWSDLVNEIISTLPLAVPFEGVEETIKMLKTQADIAVVSSANPMAIEEEWKSSGLYDLVDYFYSQADGTKSECLRKLLIMGYKPSKTIMIGDALGDLKAAQDNGLLFYPILAAQETASWKEFKSTYSEVFLKGEFNGNVQDELMEKMKENLS